MQPIPFEPGMRVRCVQPGGNTSIVKGGEYRVQHSNDFMVMLHGIDCWYTASRFKPIVRVKARMQWVNGIVPNGH